MASNWGPLVSEALHKSRIATLQDGLSHNQLDGMVVIKPEHVRYLCGLWGYSTRPEYAGPRRLVALIVPAKGDVTLIVPKIELNFARRRTGLSDVRHHVEWSSSRDEVFGGLNLLDQVLEEKQLGRGRLGLELGFVSSRLVSLISSTLPQVKFIEAAFIVEEMRMIKSDEEIATMRLGGQMAVAQFEAEVRAIRDGVCEYEIARTGALEATRLAAEHYVARDTHREIALEHPINDGLQIVTSGERLDMVHAPASTRTISTGDVVLLDFCRIPQLDHYRIGFSRMAALRELSRVETEMTQIVFRAYDAALQVLKPGVPAEEPDLVARKILDEAGLGDTFVHRTGRGVGLEGVERPEIGAGDKTPLSPGMVVTIEPSIYYQNFAVHVEDTYLVTSNGCECLTRCPRDIRIIRDAKGL